MGARPAMGIGLAIGFGLAVFGCAGANDPEKPKNDGKPVNHAAAPNSGARPTPAPPAAFVQTVAELERRTEEVEKKIDPLRRDAEANPSDARKQHALGRALYEANFMEQGIVHLERAVELNPSVRTLLDLAAAYGGAARLDDAERTCKRLLRSSPDFSPALYNLGTLARRRGKFDEAVGYLNLALEKDPKFLLARLRLGDSLNDLGRPQEAYRTYELALKLEPNTPQEASGYVEALYRLASLDLKMGAYERAGRFLTELIQMAPDHSKAYYAYGQVLLHMGYPEEAQKAFDKHVRILAAKEPTGPVAMGD